MKHKAIGKSPLFDLLRRAAQAARTLNHTPGLEAKEYIEMQREQSLSRRQFLQSMALGSIAVAGPALLSGCGPLSRILPRAHRHDSGIVIVGAGMAGLTTAFYLERAGFGTELYEASDRSGGRMFSARDLMGAGLVTELGGEFIDSTHHDIFTLARYFDLDFIDVAEDHAAGFKETFLFEGHFRSEADILAAFAPLARKIETDLEAVEELVDYQHDGNAGKLDRMSISQYLDTIGAQGWIRSLIEVAYVTEYGLEADEQSALNLMFLIGTDTDSGTFQPFGTSDERYKIRGGNDLLPKRIADYLDSPLHLGYRLEAIESRGSGYALHFQGPQGKSITKNAVAVVLTLPFSALREVDIRIDFSAAKKKAIQELRYGTNAKLFFSVRERIWRASKANGAALSDQGYQLMWDNSQLQGGIGAGVTLYSGGRAGIAVGSGTARDHIDRFMPGVEATFPGMQSARTHVAERFHWPTHPFTKGSYAAYQPGQWTTIAGAEIVPEGQIYFAGEHCSYDFQGFMNGAAETGRRAAEALLRQLGQNPSYEASL